EYRAPQAFAFDVCGRFTQVPAWNLNLNQNLNREPWSATFDILNSVKLDVNPVFRALKDRLLKPAPCTKGQGCRRGCGNPPEFERRSCKRPGWRIKGYTTARK